MKFEIDTGGSVQDEFDTTAEEENTTYRFKTCYVDADTFVVRCAKMMQEDYIEVRHIASGRSIEFRNRQSFGIRSGKIIELTEDDIAENKRHVDKEIMGKRIKEPYKWLAWKNYDQSAKGAKEFSVDDFEIFDKARLNSEFDSVEKAFKTAEMVFAGNVRGVKDNMESEDYVLLISSGNGNYRDAESKTVGYKSARGEKPIYFQDFKDKIASTYKTKIWWTDGNEAEDYIQHIAKQQEAKYGEDTSKWDACATYVDKDVNQCYIPRKNFDKYEDGWLHFDKMYCEKTLVAQTIAGDPTDTIQGLPTLTETVTKHFGLRKANGVSKTTAEKLLEGASTIQEMWERAMFCYQQYYGFDKVYDFKDVHGENQSWTWIDYMQQCYVLVKMQEYQGQIPCLRKYLTSIGVDVNKPINYDTQVVVDMKSMVDNLIVAENTIAELKSLCSKFKSLSKPDLVKRVEDITQVVYKLDGNLKMFKEE